MPRRILLTGAAGGIGTAFRRYAGDRYWFRLADRVTHNLADAATQSQDVLALDVADLAACQEACMGGCCVSGGHQRYSAPTA